MHKLSAQLKRELLTSQRLLELWESFTPLAKSEWICWIESGKKEETRKQRIEVGKSKMLSGMRRPCCWEGCSHREK